MAQAAVRHPSSGLSIRPLREHELDAADRIFRDAFETFTGIPNLFGDRDYVRTRWRASPGHALAAELNGELVGSNFVSIWGSFGLFGPLSVRKDLWDRGVARGLMDSTLDLFAAARVTHAGLFTFGQSPKHLALYQKYGFWPRQLTPVLGRDIEARPRALPAGVRRLSQLDERAMREAVAGCRAVANAVYEGLDLQREIDAVLSQRLGDVVLLGTDRIDGFAVCHAGKGTEAGSGSGYIKFAALRPGAGDPDFDRLVDGCEAVVAMLGAGRLEAGVNTARHDAYRRLVERGFRAGMIGVAMQRPNEPAFNRPDRFVIDDWR